MKRYKSLTKYQKNLPTKPMVLKAPTMSLLIGIAIVGLIIWLVMRGKPIAQYKNTERWEIIRNEQGFATEIVVHRDAKQT